jgi:isopentenyl phosphate kinase
VKERFEVGKEYVSGSNNKMRVLMRDKHPERPVVIEHTEGQFAHPHASMWDDKESGIYRVSEDARAFWTEVKPKTLINWFLSDQHGRLISSGTANVVVPSVLNRRPLAFGFEGTFDMISDLNVEIHPGDQFVWHKA